MRESGKRGPAEKGGGGEGSRPAGGSRGGRGGAGSALIGCRRGSPEAGPGLEVGGASAPPLPW